MQVSTTRNQEIIRRLVDAGNQHDTATMIALVAPNAVSHMLFDATDAMTGERIGHEDTFKPEEMEERIAFDQARFKDDVGTIDHMFDVGDNMVLTIGTYSSTHKSGKKVTTQSISLDRIEDGKVVESWFLWDRLGHWQQLGLVPSTAELLKKLEEM